MFKTSKGKLSATRSLTKVLETDVSCISVKATTTDYLGFIGNGSGISATAIIMVREVDEC